MNERLFNEFCARAAEAPQGEKMKALVAAVAEHCALICDIEADNDAGGGQAARHAANTMRAAFVDTPTKLSPGARAAATHALSLAARRH